MEKVFTIYFKNKKYEIDFEKFLFVIQKLENNSKLKINNEKEIENYFIKYGLYDVTFLSCINKI